MERILITDSVTLNSGDAAILEGIRVAVARAAPAADSRIHCHQFENVRLHYPELPLRPALGESSRIHPPRYFWRWPARRRYLAAGSHKLSLLTPFARILTTGPERASMADYRWADAIISCGGSFLTDSYHIDHVLAGYELGLALGKKMIILGQTLGPFAERRNLEAVGSVIAKFDLVAVRDEQSAEIGRQMGIPDRVLVVAADMALNLTPPLSGARQGGGRPRIGVSVRKWIYPDGDATAQHASYVTRMAAMLDLLVERAGATITFFSTCQGEPAYAYHDDEVAAEVRGAMKRGDQAAIDAAFNTPQQFMAKAAGLHAMIGTRMHACILAMLAGVPAVNVEYEFKSRELFRRMGLEDLVFDIAAFAPDHLVGAVEQILLDRPGVVMKIADGLTQLRRLNGAVEDRLGEILRG